jgi:hypothetical protein
MVISLYVLKEVMVVFKRHARQLPACAFLPATLSPARWAGDTSKKFQRVLPGSNMGLKPGGLGLAHLGSTYLTTSLDPYG